ncbi:hypothetical protein NBRC3280_2740 [Acetobacter pasteurianus NBRC 3280]|uniref:Uncharacterized protein n=1 Tax=Acetobacter pasteurianus NBRC 3278 TaxID=1226660 RepID=A0A401X7I5_ACEPA|nr:hypothetical protein NBRC3277_2767 [Acetobacter pasteurianus NBRC 3277]GCD63703.1 hypothetical protein NBRC3278_2796 [Acetobacter pasteurianus NBRC 3278]GCD70105.1 hypothetical protein NBRC3280_2740 [Acetobacter pasteurianus NBRC 3280]
MLVTLHDISSEDVNLTLKLYNRKIMRWEQGQKALFNYKRLYHLVVCYVLMASLGSRILMVKVHLVPIFFLFPFLHAFADAFQNHHAEFFLLPSMQELYLPI